MNWRERIGLDGRFFGPEGNPYLRLSEGERYRLVIRWLLWLIGSVCFLWALKLFGWHTT